MAETRRGVRVETGPGTISASRLRPRQGLGVGFVRYEVRLGGSRPADYSRTAGDGSATMLGGSLLDPPLILVAGGERHNVGPAPEARAGTCPLRFPPPAGLLSFSTRLVNTFKRSSRLLGRHLATLHNRTEGLR
jgi:hypothetical protein